MLKSKILLILSFLFIYTTAVYGQHGQIANQDAMSVDPPSNEIHWQIENLNVDSAEQYTIKGYVFDSSYRIGIAQADVRIKNTIKNCITDKTGHFELKLPQAYVQKNFFLNVSYVGYNISTLKIENKADV